MTETLIQTVPIDGDHTAGPPVAPGEPQRRTIAQMAGFDLGDPALEQLLLAQIYYMWIDDPDITLVALASVVSSAIEEGEPLWLMLVGPSSGGKGESLRIVDQAVHKRIKDLTLAGLLSKDQRSGDTVGLLTEVQDQSAVVSITDFSALLSPDKQSGGAKMEIFNALRDIYDGEYSRTMNRGVAAWRGRLTMVAACTPAIDTFAAHSDSLGTRWLYYRMPMRDSESRRRISQMAASRRDLAANRAAAADLAVGIIDAARRRAPHVALEPDLEELVIDCALMASYGRSSVPREAWGKREITDAVVPEEPGRVTHQLRILARSLLALGTHRHVVDRILRRTALGSMPMARARALDAIARTGAPMSTNALSRGTDLAGNVAKRAAEDLEAIGLITGGRDPEDLVSTRPSQWVVADEHRATLDAALGLRAE